MFFLIPDLKDGVIEKKPFGSALFVPSLYLTQQVLHFVRDDGGDCAGMDGEDGSIWEMA